MKSRSRVLLVPFIFVLFICKNTISDTTNEIIVTATPLAITANDTGKSVDSVSLETVPFSDSPGTLLEEATSISVFERGSHNVQTDLSIRGSTFQQVLLTIDGLPATDPQTAHHNMDIPFPVSAISRMTIIPGPGSALFGPTAFAGTIDITTRHPKDTGLQFLSSYGSFETYRAEASADIVRGPTANIFSSSYSTSDGFMDGTDYEVFSTWGSTFIESDSAQLRISGGYTDKDFGAQDFYASYPSRELTSSMLFDIAPQIQLESGWHIEGIARYRRHDDEFILIEDNPSFYMNEHTSESFIEKIILTSPTHSLGRTAFGVERSDSFLESSNIGDQSAFISSAFAQHMFKEKDNYAINAGVRIDDHDQWGTEISPSLSFSSAINESLNIRAAGSKAIRPPSFTELYYIDPRNIGNPALDPEETWGVETGFDLDIAEETTLSATYFLRNSDDLIDWIRNTSDAPWEATNIGKTTTQGIELKLKGSAGISRWQLNYIYMDIDADNNDFESKYALNYAEHDAGIMLGTKEIKGFSPSINLRYRDVPTLDQYWLLTAMVSQRIGNATIFIKGKNLLNETYEEIPGVPTAGRYAETGIELNW